MEQLIAERKGARVALTAAKKRLKNAMRDVPPLNMTLLKFELDRVRAALDREQLAAEHVITLMDETDEGYDIAMAEYEGIAEEIGRLICEVEDMVARQEPTQVAPNARNTGATRTIKIDPPEKLEASVTLEDFEQWRVQYEIYASSQALENVKIKQRVDVLWGRFTTPMATKVEYELMCRRDGSMDTDDILDEIYNHLREGRSILVDLVRFQQRTQRTGEPFAEFLADLTVLANRAKVCETCRDLRMVTQVVSGLADPETRKKIFKKKFMTLKDVKQFCQDEDFGRANVNNVVPSKAKANAISGTTSNTGKTNDSTKTSRGRSRSSSRQRGRTPERKAEVTTCRKCGNADHKADEKCPASDRRCYKCHEEGHLSRVCPKKKSSKGKQVTTNAVMVHSTVTVEHRIAPMINIHVDVLDGKGAGTSGEVKATPDSACTGFVCGTGTIRDLGLNPKRDLRALDTQDELLVADGSKADVAGKIKVRAIFNDVPVEATMFVVPGCIGVLVPWWACIRFGILPQDYPEPIRANAIVDGRVDDHQVTVSNSVKHTKIENQKLDACSVVPGTNTSSEERRRVAEMQRLKKKYRDVFKSSEDEELPPMKAKPVVIDLKDDARPYAIHAPYSIPIAYEAAAKAELDRLERSGIIRRVYETSDWCHPFLAVNKGDGKLRICVDLRRLNEYVKRPSYPMRTPQQVLDRLPPEAQFFTTLDALKGYFQLDLEEASRHLTTFMTNWGRYEFLRCPIGLSSAQDSYDRITDEALENLDRVGKLRDDIIAASRTWDEHVKDVEKVLERCRQHGITISEKKFNFGQRKVTFLGVELSADGIAADTRKISAIQEFPSPKNLTELKSFLGLANQLGGFTAKMSEACGPLRPLLRKAGPFIWTEDSERAFKNVKKVLESPDVLALFDLTKPTRLLTDASRLNGLGYVMQQLHGDTWKLVQAGSRFITDTESAYSMVELELLAAVWAMKKLRHFLLGIQFELVVDHQPLLSILNDKTLDMIDSPRIQRLKEKTAPFIFQTKWVKGSGHHAADALSRCPTANPTEEDIVAGKVDEHNLQRYLRACMVVVESRTDKVANAVGMESNETADPMLNRIANETTNDDELQEVMKAIKQGRKPAHPYSQLGEEASIVNGIIVFRGRIVIPKTMREEILSRLHSSHLGIVRTKQRARQTVYWPQITANIEDAVRRCERCQADRPSQTHEPIVEEGISGDARPFEEWHADLFEEGRKHYLVVVDRASGYPMITGWNSSPTSTKVIKALRMWFADFGIPSRFRCDGGPQFKSKEMSDFLDKWGVERRISSPYHHESNGRAEAGCKALKALVRHSGGDIESDEFLRGLLEWRNVPKAHGRSPAEIVFGAQQRSWVPCIPNKLDRPMNDDDKSWKTQRDELRSKQRVQFDLHSRELKPLSHGQLVRIQDPTTKKWIETGRITGVFPRRRYAIRLGNGVIRHRNRKFIRARVEGEDDDEGGMDDDSDDDNAVNVDQGPRRSKRERKPPIQFRP